MLNQLSQVLLAHTCVLALPFVLFDMLLSLIHLVLLIADNTKNSSFFDLNFTELFLLVFIIAAFWL